MNTETTEFYQTGSTTRPCDLCVADELRIQSIMRVDSTARGRIYDAIRYGTSTVTELADATGLSASTICKALTRNPDKFTKGGWIVDYSGHRGAQGWRRVRATCTDRIDA